MKEFIVRAVIVGVFALAGSGAAIANGDCGMNSNKPCPPPKSSAKEPAYQGMNSNKPTAQQATETTPARKTVQAKQGDAPVARASLAGVSASDLKPPPQDDCGMNSNKPCADEAKEATPARVQSSDDGDTAARATLSGVNPNDLKVKPKPTSTSEKEPASKP